MNVLHFTTILMLIFVTSSASKCPPNYTESASGSCLGLVGSECVGPNKGCTSNSECSYLCDNVDRITGEKTTEDVCWDECLCNEHLGFKKSKENFCLGSHGSKCSDGPTEQCNPDFQCIQGKCACNESLSVYSAVLKKCQGLVDQVCIDDQLCVDTAQCMYLCDNWDPVLNITTKEDICVHKCLCPADVYASPEVELKRSTPIGYCQAHEDGPCGNSDKNCLPGLVCQDSHCKCPFPSHQYYNKTQEKCITLAYGPCELSLSTSVCVENAECTTDEDNAQVSHCQCDLIHIDDGHGFCKVKLNYGESCPLPDFVCDPEARLFCTDGKCQCKDKLLFYNEDIKRCQGKVGGFCKVSDKQGCGDGAHCLLAPGFETRWGEGTGLCECDDQKHLLVDRTCH